MRIVRRAVAHARRDSPKRQTGAPMPEFLYPCPVCKLFVAKAPDEHYA
jgi:hypothetical protein